MKDSKNLNFKKNIYEYKNYEILEEIDRSDNGLEIKKHYLIEHYEFEKLDIYYEIDIQDFNFLRRLLNQGYTGDVEGKIKYLIKRIETELSV